MYADDIFLLSEHFSPVGQLKKIVGSNFIEFGKRCHDIGRYGTFAPFIPLILSGVHTEIFGNLLLSVVPVLTQFTQTGKFFGFTFNKSSSPFLYILQHVWKKMKK